MKFLGIESQLKFSFSIRKAIGALTLILCGALFACSNGNSLDKTQAALDAVPDPSDMDASLQRNVDRYRKNVQSNRDALESLGRLAMSFHANGYEKEAALLYRELGYIDGNEPHWKYLLALILAEYGQNERAIPLFEQVVEADPSYLPVRINLADSLSKSGSMEKAIETFRAALVVEPEFGHALLGLGRIAIDKSDWQDAKSWLEKASQQSQTRVAAQAMLVTVYDRLGDFESAELYRSQTEVPVGIDDPWKDTIWDYCFDSYRLSVIVAEKLERGDSQAAERLLQRAVKQDSENVLLQRQLGSLLRTTGHYDAARSHIQKAIEIDRKDSENWIELLNLEKAMRSETGMIRAIDLGLSHNPDSPALLREKGKVLGQAGEFESAKAYLEKVIRIKPTDGQAYVDLVFANYQLEDLESAKQVLIKGLEHVPNHSILLTIYTRVLIEEGLQIEAAAFLKKLVSHPNVEKAAKIELIGFYRERFESLPDLN